MGELHVKFNVSPEEFLADLTQAVYQVVLKAGFDIPFIKMELDLQSALREVIRKDMLVSEGLKNRSLLFVKKITPWSVDANIIFKKIEATYELIGLGGTKPPETVVFDRLNSTHSTRK